MPIFFLLCAMSLAVYATSTDELIAQAHHLKLSEERYWHLLMHTPKEESEVDDPAFFLARDGKTDLSAELDATIRHLNEDANRSDESVFCRFPARRAWLEKELQHDFGQGECAEYEALMEKVDPQKVSLIFPSAHINSPASMFGHTFLRIDSKMESKLMSYAINYAAHTEDTNGLLFAYKGLFGGYYGFYSMLPYYDKLKEYRDTEARDVWEYDLNLTPDEVRAMVRHIWELQRINSWYFFFDENCSYHMLWLAEIARPEANLRDHFWYYVIPPETVRAFEDEELVSEKHYRPSKRTKVLAYEEVLTPQSIATVKSILEGELDPSDQSLQQSDVQQHRYILETAAEMTEYRYIQGKISKEEYVKRYHAILSERAKLGLGDPLPLIGKSNPDTAHRGGRVSVSQGWNENRSPVMFGWRPAFHDIYEDDTGHLPGAQIEFLDLLLGVDHERVSLEKLTLLSLASIVPVSHFFTPFSWRMKSGWDRDYGGDHPSFVTRVGAGSSIGNDRMYGYLLSEPEIRFGFNTDAGIGIKGGGVVNWGDRMKSTLEIGKTLYWDEQMRDAFFFSHLWQWSSRGSIFGNYEILRQGERQTRMKIGFNLYF